MSVLKASFDNIRLIRRKLSIAQNAAKDAEGQAERDAAVVETMQLLLALGEAVDGFADAGFEDRVAQLIDAEVARSNGVQPDPRPDD